MEYFCKIVQLTYCISIHKYFVNHGKYVQQESYGSLK